MRKQNYLASAERHEIGDRPPGNMSGSLEKKILFFETITVAKWDVISRDPRKCFSYFLTELAKIPGPWGSIRRRLQKI